MAESWRWGAKHYCQYCKFWIPDTVQSRKQHESSERHQNAIKNHIQNQRKQKAQQEKEERQLKQELLRIDLAATEKYEQDLYGPRGGTNPQPIPQNLPVPSVGGEYQHNQPAPLPKNVILPPPPPPDPQMLFNGMGILPPPPDPQLFFAMMNQGMAYPAPSVIQHIPQPQMPTTQNESPALTKQKIAKKKNKKRKNKEKPSVETPRKHMTKEEAYYNDPNFFFYAQDEEESDEEEEKKEIITEKREEQNVLVEGQEASDEQEDESPLRKKYKKELSDLQHTMIRNAPTRSDVDPLTGFGQWDVVDTNVVPSSCILNPQEEKAEEQPTTEAATSVQSSNTKSHVDKLFNDDEDEPIGIVGSYYERPKTQSNGTQNAKTETAQQQLTPAAAKPMMGFSMQIKKKKN